MRLIDANALRDKLQKEIDKGIPPYDDVIGSIRCGVRLARNIVEDEPTIEAIPIEWIMRYAFDGKRKHPISITKMIADWRKENDA